MSVCQKDVKNHLLETACPRFAAEAVPPMFFHFANELGQ